MIQATVSEVKNGLSAFLRRVRTGESVLVLDRKTPVACIVPVSHLRGSRKSEARLTRLEAAGIVARERPGTGSPLEVLGQPLRPHANVLDALLEERRDGR